MMCEQKFMGGLLLEHGGHFDGATTTVNAAPRRGGTFDQPPEVLVLQDLPAFPLFSKTVKELLGLYAPTEDAPLQLASFVHYAGKDLLNTLVNALMEDNVLQAFNTKTGFIETLATAVNSSGHFLRVNPHFTSVPPLRLYTHFVSMVMTTIIMHPTGKCSNLLRLVTGHSRNGDIRTYFKDLSLHFLFGSGFWPAPSPTLVTEASASMAVQVVCSVPFVSQVVAQLETFFFLPRLFQIVHEQDKCVMTRLVRLRPQGCPLGTFVCQHDNGTNDNNGFFTLRVFFSGDKNDHNNSVLMQEATAGTVTIVHNLPSMVQPYVEEPLPYRKKVNRSSTPEVLLPMAQCQEVRRVTAYLRTSSLLAPHRITCNNVTAPGEMEVRRRLGSRASVLQTLPGGHERMVLSLAIALHLENPLAIQVVVARDVDTYLPTLNKYNHGKHIAVMRSVDDLHHFSGHRRVFLLAGSMITSEFADIIQRFRALVVRSLIVDVLEALPQNLLLVNRIFKHEQLVVAQPKQPFQHKKKPSAKIEVFSLESTSHNVQDIIMAHSRQSPSADLLHATLARIDIKGDGNISADLQDDLKRILLNNVPDLYPVVVCVDDTAPLTCKRRRSDDYFNSSQQHVCKRRKERAPFFLSDAFLVTAEVTPSAKFTAFKEKILPSLLSQQRSYFNVLIVVSDSSVFAYQEECQRNGLSSALFGYVEQNITRDRKLLVQSLKNDKLQVLFVPSLISWSHTFKMQNVVIIDACSAKDNIGKNPSELGRRRCIVMSEKNSYTQWRLQENNGFNVDANSVQSCLQYLSGTTTTLV
jgi:hypothetical protein